MTASPLAEHQPSSTAASDALRIVRGMVRLEARREPARQPESLRKRVTTRIVAATAIRSCTRISFETAAAISGVMPGASAREHVAGRVRTQQPVAELADGQVRDEARTRPHRECRRSAA